MRKTTKVIRRNCPSLCSSVYSLGMVQTCKRRTRNRVLSWKNHLRRKSVRTYGFIWAGGRSAVNEAWLTASPLQAVVTQARDKVREASGQPTNNKGSSEAGC